MPGEVQAVTADAAAAAAVCHVPDRTPDPCAPHQQGPACLDVLPSSALVHCRPLHQLPCLHLVSPIPFSPDSKLYLAMSPVLAQLLLLQCGFATAACLYSSYCCGPQADYSAARAQSGVHSVLISPS